MTALLLAAFLAAGPDLPRLGAAYADARAAALAAREDAAAARFRELADRAVRRAAWGDGRVTRRWVGLDRRVTEHLVERAGPDGVRRLRVRDTEVWAHRLPRFTVRVVELERVPVSGPAALYAADADGRHSGPDRAGFEAERAWWERELGLAGGSR